jgi:hypothetical protein
MFTRKRFVAARPDDITNFKIKHNGDLHKFERDCQAIIAEIPLLRGER